MGGVWQMRSEECQCRGIWCIHFGTWQHCQASFRWRACHCWIPKLHFVKSTEKDLGGRKRKTKMKSATVLCVKATSVLLHIAASVLPSERESGEMGSISCWYWNSMQPLRLGCFVGQSVDWHASLYFAALSTMTSTLLEHLESGPGLDSPTCEGLAHLQQL